MIEEEEKRIEVSERNERKRDRQKVRSTRIGRFQETKFPSLTLSIFFSLSSDQHFTRLIILVRLVSGFTYHYKANIYGIVTFVMVMVLVIIDLISCQIWFCFLLVFLFFHFFKISFYLNIMIMNDFSLSLSLFLSFCYLNFCFINNFCVNFVFVS